MYLLFITQALKNVGLDHVMNVYLTGITATNPQSTSEVSAAVNI